MRLRVLYLFTEPGSGRYHFALVADDAADLSPDDVEALRHFGGEVGADGVLVLSAPVAFEDDVVDGDETPPRTFVDVDPAGLGTAVAQSIRTYLETVPQRLRGGIGD